MSEVYLRHTVLEHDVVDGLINYASNFEEFDGVYWFGLYVRPWVRPFICSSITYVLHTVKNGLR